MPVIEVCNGYIFGTDGGVLGHQINNNISLLQVGHYEGLRYNIDCKLYRMVYQTETFSAQLVGINTAPTPTILDSPKLISINLSLSLDTIPNITWQYQSFPMAGDCGGILLPELTPSVTLGNCSFSIDGNVGTFEKVESVSFSEQLDLVTKELGTGGAGESIDDPLAAFGFVIAKQINRKMSISTAKNPGNLAGSITATATSADGGTSCHISEARIDGVGENYSADNFAKFDISLSAEEAYQGL